MESALSWVGRFFDFLFSLLPTLFICRTTHQGIRFTYGNNVKIISHNNGIFLPHFFWYNLNNINIPCLKFKRTGIHFYWPIVTEFELVPIKRQTTNLVPQYLCTVDNKTIGVSGILVYEVSEVEKLLTHTYDYDDTIQDLALATVKNVIVKHNLNFLINNSQDLDKELTKALKIQLKPFGIKTLRCTLSDLTPCRVLAHWGLDVTVNNGEEDEE